MSHWDKEREIIPKELESVKLQIQQTELKLESLREKMTTILVGGVQVGIDITDLSLMSGLSRETIYKHLRSRDKLTWKQKHKMAKAAGIPPGDARKAWFESKGWI